MKILGIDTSGLVASVAIVDENELLCEFTINYKKTHSQTLMPMLDVMCEATNIDLKEIDVIAVASGPGSFTGLRIGAATAKGLAQGLNKPMVGVPTLDGLAYNVCHAVDQLICPIMDARRNQVYTASYQTMNHQLQRLTEYRAIPIGELLQELQQQNAPILFLGDGVTVYQDIIESTLPSTKYEWIHAPNNRQRGSSIATLGMQLVAQGQLQEYTDFAPFYLRPSQAEREYEEKHK
ncbi:MAG: tRNA (adenosine(37)-N6)-threonylcarbamoyltransferase complex dimerization subunit type 1 TsaB [Epulopiscium sp.]|nr:tRNA (adenosine(37)-N6)-threonylcarbamoyltransferase complex dimerization subunit type 1 TsaB [Candidatus Epulonipiscium sp.]